MRLVHDAMLEGQLRALRRVHERVGLRVIRLNELIETAAEPVERMKLRGSVDELELFMRELDEEIAAVALERGS